MSPFADIPVSDPTPQLAPTARRLLDAAVRVLDQHGFSGLTFERIAQEAGENAALIRYHFGSKSGLVRDLVDVVLFAEAEQLMATLSPLQGSERREALFREQRHIAVRLTTFRRFYELIPHILRDPELRLKLRDFLRWYWTMDGWAITGEYLDAEQVVKDAPLGLLSVAMFDGLALQMQADPALDIEPAFQLWEALVLQYVGGSGAERGTP